MTIKRILLLGATFGTGNMGVGALAFGSLKVLLTKYPEASISFLDYGAKSTTAVVDINGKKITVPLINLRFSWKLFLPNNVAYLILLSVLISFIGPKARNAVVERNAWLKSICEADVAFAISGGDSFSDIYGMRRFFYVCLPQILVTILGVNLILLPQTIGPFENRVAKIVARFIMRRSQTVFSRDAEGTSKARSLIALDNMYHKVRFCYDVGFVLESRKPKCLDLGGFEQKQPDNTLLIGINVSGLLYIGGYSQDNMFALQHDYESIVQRIVSYFIDVEGANVLLVPHVFGDSAESDTLAVRAIYESMTQQYPNSLFCALGSYDQNEIKYIIGLCDFFLGSRMHACIAALSQSIPAVGVAYSKKFIGVMESIGKEHLVADLRRLTMDDLLKLINSAFTERQATKKSLQETMPQVKSEVLNL